MSCGSIRNQLNIYEHSQGSDHKKKMVSFLEVISWFIILMHLHSMRKPHLMPSLWFDFVCPVPLYIESSALHPPYITSYGGWELPEMTLSYKPHVSAWWGNQLLPSGFLQGGANKERSWPELGAALSQIQPTGQQFHAPDIMHMLERQRTVDNLSLEEPAIGIRKHAASDNGERETITTVASSLWQLYPPWICQIFF